MDARETMTVRIIDSRLIGADIREFTVRSESASPLPPFEPGAHVDVHLTADMIRQYSLVAVPANPAHYRIAVAREQAGRGGSAYMHDELETGDLLRIGMPRCHFALCDTGGHSIFIAGGIGITPIWSMVQRLSEEGKSWELHYAARTRAHAAYLDEIRHTASAQGGNVRTYFNLEGDPLMDLSAIAAAASAGTQFYCCGPAGLLEAYRTACESLPEDHVHWEQFEAAAPAAVEGGFVVELAKSGREIEIVKGQTILDALGAAGLSASYSCREGVCGSCETAVLAGTPDHRDAILTDAEKAEGRTMMICCSGSLSDRLVLDL